MIKPVVFTLLGVLFSILTVVGCGSSSSNNTPDSSADVTPSSDTKPLSLRLGQFSAFPHFSTSEIIRKAGGNAPSLTYELKLYIYEGQFKGGNFNIYDCQDLACSGKKLKYIVRCNDKFDCVPLEASGREIKKGMVDQDGKVYAAGPESVVPFVSIFAADENGKFFRQYLLVYFVDPHLMVPDDYGQYVAVEFEPKGGGPTGLKVTQMTH